MRRKSVLAPQHHDTCPPLYSRHSYGEIDGRLNCNRNQYRACSLHLDPPSSGRERGCGAWTVGGAESLEPEGDEAQVAHPPSRPARSLRLPCLATSRLVTSRLVSSHLVSPGTCRLCLAAWLPVSPYLPLFARPCPSFRGRRCSRSSTRYVAEDKGWRGGRGNPLKS